MNRNDAAIDPVGRLAPSPTGELHLGHARSFLIAWWHARSRGGRIVLRFEDLDRTRTDDTFVDIALRDLEWLGLDWDDEPLFQSQRRNVIIARALDLQDRGLAYACTCSRANIRHAVGAPHASDEEPVYPGTCRSPQQTMADAEARTGKEAGLRFSVSSEPIVFSDELQGRFSHDLSRSPGDFLILRRDKTPAYQLSVVVDDHFQGVTEVVRGDDLLSSTPRQLALLNALGYPAPAYYHVPLVVDDHGNRLAKRDQARSLRSLREAGLDARQVIQWVASTCGLPVDDFVTALELVPEFDIRSVPKSVVQLRRETIEHWLGRTRRNS